jgi:hypothetical protein
VPPGRRGPAAQLAARHTPRNHARSGALQQLQLALCDYGEKGGAWATRRGGQEAGPPRRVERVDGAAANPMEAAFNGARRGKCEFGSRAHIFNRVFLSDRCM